MGLESISQLIGGPRIDDVLRRAAGTAPGRTALRAGGRELTFAELDERVSGCAAALRTLVGGPDVVVALGAVLDPVFAVAFFGIARAGNVTALVGPLLREEGLEHVLGASGAVVAIVSPEMYERIGPLRERLPSLRHVILTRPAAGTGLPVLDELIDAAPDGTVAPAGEDPEAVACIQFTNGTTGPPKAVLLTHRNLTVNAAQTAYAHRLDESSVLLNGLPIFHMMHLTAGVTAGATHVLSTEGDVAASVESAARNEATHFYSLPMLLTRLAAHPRLPELSAPSLRAVLSGGSALPPQVTEALAGHFGVPVIQGYGLAETSPLTHCDLIEAPTTGSCGPPVPGTECRIVDLETRAVLPAGERGEVEVRGPQLMKGYLGRERSADVDPDGWFATGDVGYADSGGRLFLVDRIKDVFKCDNYLVSPTEIERVLRRHPGVADCAVVDYPDEFSGAVAYAVVVPADGDVRPAELAEFVAARLPYYEHVRHVELAASIPRTANGAKVRRRELRERVRSGR